MKAAKRRFVTERAQEYCEYCRCPAKYSSTGFSIDHITPRVAGGNDEVVNLRRLLIAVELHPPEQSQTEVNP